MPFDAAKLAKLQAQATQSRIGMYGGVIAILDDTGAITNYHPYYSLLELHADSPSLFPTFPAITTALSHRQLTLLFMDSSNNTSHDVVYARCLCST